MLETPWRRNRLSSCLSKVGVFVFFLLMPWQWGRTALLVCQTHSPAEKRKPRGDKSQTPGKTSHRGNSCASGALFCYTTWPRGNVVYLHYWSKMCGKGKRSTIQCPNWLCSRGAQRSSIETTTARVCVNRGIVLQPSFESCKWILRTKRSLATRGRR